MTKHKEQEKRSPTVLERLVHESIVAYKAVDFLKSQGEDILKESYDRQILLDVNGRSYVAYAGALHNGNTLNILHEDGIENGIGEVQEGILEYIKQFKEEHPIAYQTIKIGGGAVLLLLLAAGCGDGRDNGGSGTINPEEADDIGSLTNAPDMMPANTMDFWQNNTGGYGKLTTEAKDALNDLVTNGLTAGDEQVSKWGVNSDGVVYQVEIIAGGNPNGYTDSNLDGNPDYVVRFKTDTTPGLASTALADLDAKINNTSDSPDKVKELVSDYIVHNWGSASFDYSDYGAVPADINLKTLILTGYDVPVDVNAEEFGYVLNFTMAENLRTTPDDRTNMESEWTASGQKTDPSGKPNTGNAHDIVESGDTSGGTTKKVDDAMFYVVNHAVQK